MTKIFENAEAVLAWQMLVSKWRIDRSRLKGIKLKLYGNSLPYTIEMVEGVGRYLEKELEENARRFDTGSS